MGIKIINLPDQTGMPDNGDYFAVTDGSVTSKLNYSLLAQAIIENYAGSSLAGSLQSIKDAIDSINTDLTTLETMEDITSQVTTTAYVNNVVFYRFGRVFFLRFAVLSTMPVASWTTVMSIPNDVTPINDVACATSNFNTANVGKILQVAVRLTSEVRGYLDTALSSGGSVTCTAVWIK